MDLPSLIEPNSRAYLVNSLKNVMTLELVFIIMYLILECYLYLF